MSFNSIEFQFIQHTTHSQFYSRHVTHFYILYMYIADHQSIVRIIELD